MSGVLGRGLAAGAVGTTVLNAVTYVDMAVRGRPASDTPAQTVQGLLAVFGTGIPGEGEVRASRREALGALSGITTGLAVGIGTSLARKAGVRLPAPLGVLATSAAAMAASDVPVAALGISDPRTWSSSSWVSDCVPHLAYGVATQFVLRRVAPSPPRVGVVPATRPSAGLLLRSLLLGVATGGRTSLGLAIPVLTTSRTPGRLGNPAVGAGGKTAAVLGLGGELVLDKLPSTPSRLEPPSLAGRLVSGAGGAGMLARRENARATLPVLFGTAGAAAGSCAGAAWRGWADGQLPDWQAGLVEDVVALGLALAASLPKRRAASPHWAA